MSDRSDETGQEPETSRSGDSHPSPPAEPHPIPDTPADATESHRWPDPPPEIPDTKRGPDEGRDAATAADPDDTEALAAVAASPPESLEPEAATNPAETEALAVLAPPPAESLEPVPAADPAETEALPGAAPPPAEALDPETTGPEATTASTAPGGGRAERHTGPNPESAGATERSAPAEPDATQAFPAASPTEAFEPEAAAGPDAATALAAPEGNPTEALAAPVAESAGTVEPPDSSGTAEPSVPTEPDATRLFPATAYGADSPAPDRPNGPPFLTASGLTARGHQGPIFTGVDLVTGLGQLVAVCGDSGDGRTSLLLALSGRFAFQSGALRVDGQTRPGQIRRRFTVAQAGPPIRFDEYHTVASCIKETTAVSGGTATRANIHAWLDRLAVDVDTGDTFGFLPRIDQITFAIACAAAGRTPAIVVDDADTGLDRCGSERVFEALRTVADAGQLVLAACTRSDPPADAVIDLRGQDRGPGGRRAGRTSSGRTSPDHGRPDHRNGDSGATRHRRDDARNGGHQ